MDNLQETLARSFEAGNFLQTIFELWRKDPTPGDGLALAMATLHNEGRADVVAAFTRLSRKNDQGLDFFFLRHLFEQALPHLDAPVISVMRCVLRLYREAGQDMAGGTTPQAFFGFCTSEPSRPRAALREIESQPGDFACLLSPALAAGSRTDSEEYLLEAVRLSEAADIELRRYAVQAFRALSMPQGVPVPDLAFTTLQRSVAVESDDRILAEVVSSAFALLQQDATQEARAVTLIHDALCKGDDVALYTAAQVFGFHTKDLPKALLDELIVQLMRTRPQSKGTLDLIDVGLSHLITSSHLEQGLRFLEDLLVAHSGQLTLAIFDSAAAHIHNDRALLNRLLTRWFLRGEPVLCQGLQHISASHHEENLRLEVDPTELAPVSAVRLLSVAGKSVGYFFLQPVTAASVVISLMRLTTEEDILQQLGSLLFDPILLNFTGSARDYAFQQAPLESGKVRETIDAVLKKLDSYLETLRSMGTLAALHPGEAQQEAYHRHTSRTMAESFKAAQAQSPLLSMVHKSVLLYGRKSINYVYDRPGTPPRRMETSLSSFGTHMELARMDQIDPFGLDFAIRLLQRGRPRS